ncbi:hypothetical protein MGR01S_26890 [Meiothermus granaticius NBRC 107808]|uniref:Uncharacterized protein n=2 Tax=Meiothermus TaxID=65551 RepID=A0A399FBD7_9DEIN|nr:hypothetical protein Mgrana_01489 [Meiothermus granaticius NBRC 107808]GEM88064.1 hypothetical protein MGR01S_26890 [Meiothermus granaticius NBRC 107808]
MYWHTMEIGAPPQEYGADLDKLRTYSLSVLLWCFGVQENPRLLPPPCPPEAQRLGLCFPYEKVLNYRHSG